MNSELAIKELLTRHFAGTHTRVFLFGSRATGSASPGSDFDIGLQADSPISDRKLAVVRADLDELPIPYKVDIVDFSQVDESFKQEALRKIVEWPLQQHSIE